MYIANFKRKASKKKNIFAGTLISMLDALVLDF